VKGLYAFCPYVPLGPIPIKVCRAPLRNNGIFINLNGKRHGHCLWRRNTTPTVILSRGPYFASEDDPRGAATGHHQRPTSAIRCATKGLRCTGNYSLLASTPGAA
jgi:hypothetical protein